MPLRADIVLHKVTIAGDDVTAFCEKSSCKFGFDIAASECALTMAYLDPSFTYWDRVQVWAGTHSDVGDTASDLAGQPDGILRFDGYLTDLDFSLWPQTVTVKANGPLILAQRAICPDDDAVNHIKDADPLALPPTYKEIAPGILLSANPDTDADWTDAEMVTWLLAEANVTDRIGSIGGTGRKLGIVAFDQYVWKRGTSALSFIQDLDKVCFGLRTFEALGGVIQRAQASLYAPFERTAYTLIEGTDFLDGTLNRNAKDARNKVVVSGYDLGKSPIVFALVGSCPNLPPGVAVAADESPPSSPLIEYEEEADRPAGEGLSCEAVATWRLSELRYPLLTCSFSTWRDDPYSPAQVAYLNSPMLDNINQSTWIKSVTIDVEAGQFTQKLECVSTAWRDRFGRPLLPMSLPAPLVVSP